MFIVRTARKQKRSAKTLTLDCKNYLQMNATKGTLDMKYEIIHVRSENHWNHWNQMRELLC